MIYLGIVPSQLHCIPNLFNEVVVLDLTCNKNSAKEIIRQWLFRRRRQFALGIYFAVIIHVCLYRQICYYRISDSVV